MYRAEAENSVEGEWKNLFKTKTSLLEAEYIGTENAICSIHILVTGNGTLLPGALPQLAQPLAGAVFYDPFGQAIPCGAGSGFIPMIRSTFLIYIHLIVVYKTSL